MGDGSEIMRIHDLKKIKSSYLESLETLPKKLWRKVLLGEIKFMFVHDFMQ